VSTSDPQPSRRRAAWLLALALAVLAYLAHAGLHAVPNLPGSAILALVFGLVVGNAGVLPSAVRGGMRGVVKHSIGPAIVLIGAGLDLAVLADPRIGLRGFVTVVGAMGAAFLSSMLFAGWCGLSRRTGLLLGAGTAVCGNSAIVAAAPVVKAGEDEIVLSLGVINLLGVLAMFAVPPLGLLAGLGRPEVGILSGTTIHAVPQAVAAGESLGPDALALATLFKLVRVALLAPTIVLLALTTGRGEGARPGAGRLLRQVPWFVWGFLLAALLHSVGALDARVALPGLEAAPLARLLQSAGKFLLAAALAAIGLQIEVRAFLRVGPKVLLSGTLAAATMVATALVLQWGLA